MDCEEIWTLLVSHGKLERDKGVARVQEELSSNGSVIASLIQRIEAFRINSGQENTSWETKLGILSASKAIVDGWEWRDSGERFLDCCLQRSKALLTDEEVRVRLACGELLGSLAGVQGNVVYDDCKDLLTSLIRENLERKGMEGERRGSSGSGGGSPLPGRPNSPFGHTSESIFHETAGWRNLETSVKCLQLIVEASNVVVDLETLDLVFASVDHTNRFVRETGYYTLGAIVKAGAKGDDSPDVYTSFGQVLTSKLSEGMADNWSQVRLAATTATRQFLTGLPPHLPNKFQIHASLLPRLCLNRYYLAEGVRIYSQETWKMVTALEEGGGRQVVIDHIDSVVSYYITSTKADNHAVREAACQCIAELAAKIDSSVLGVHVDRLLDTLVDCFNDDSWPVRDMACVASGKFVLNYPKESERCRVQLESLFFENLHDSISSVRQGGALSIANLVRAYGLSDEIIVKLNESLDGVKDQAVSSSGGDLPSTNPAQEESSTGPLAKFGVAKRYRDNDFSTHEDQVMYSCGSLAPKMSRSGCTDCKFKRLSELWEKGDGAVYLIGELSAIDECKPKLTNSILKAAEVCRNHHYVAHFSLIETVLKTLPAVAQNLGKRVFKGQFLEEFLDCLFYALDSRDHALASAAASQCLEFLTEFIGPNILRGRVEQHNPRYLPLMDTNSMVNQGPMSPLGLGRGAVSISPGSPFSSPPPPKTLAIPIEPRERTQSLGGTPTNSPRQ